jgi:NAD+ synthase
MDWIPDCLNIDPPGTCLQIEELLRHKLQQMKRDGAIIGLSGGLDSAVVSYISAKALGQEKITLYYLPDRDSKAIHRQHAGVIAEELGVDLQTRDITPLLEPMGIYGLLPIGFMPGRTFRQAAVKLGKSLADPGRPRDLLATRFRPTANSLVAKGNAYAMVKHRLRMVLLYYQAEILNLMVVGAANRTELLTGTFSMWGCDHCADVMPIIHLYRSQLAPIAEYLQVPEMIRSKPADPDILPGVDNKEELLGSFLEADQILWGLENGVDRDELIQRFDRDLVEHIENLRELSRPMRESPYFVGMDNEFP